MLIATLRSVSSCQVILISDCYLYYAVFAALFDYVKHTTLLLIYRLLNSQISLRTDFQ